MNSEIFNIEKEFASVQGAVIRAINFTFNDAILVNNIH